MLHRLLVGLSQVVTQMALDSAMVALMVAQMS